MSIIMPLPMSTAGGSQTSLLADYAATPLDFGPPSYRSSAVISSGTREVMMGPRSPVRGYAALMANGTGTGEVNGHMNGSRTHETEKANGKKESVGGSLTLAGSVENSTPAASSSRTLVDATPVASPSRKGKEVAQTPTKGGARSSNGVDVTWPAEFAGLKRAGAGLDNPSNACYANATLQVLLHTPPVLATALVHSRDSCEQVRTKGYCVLCALRSMASRHYSQKYYNPTEIHGSLGKIRKGFSKHRQEDTHEFFRFMTDGLQATATVKMPKDTPEKIKQTTWVYKTWGGKIRSRVVCLRCKKPSDTFDSFLDLSLDVPKGNRPDVYQMLKGYCKEDKLSGDNKYHCENCKSKADATKSFRIAEVPPVLTLVLKRFRINYSAYSGKARADKYNEFIDYPEMLDMAPYMVDPKEPGTKYRLFGVTCHRGASLSLGHYTSFVRGPDGRWFDADDSDVSGTTLKTVLNARTAYLLSYIRVSETEYSKYENKSATPGGTPITTPSTIGWSVPDSRVDSPSSAGKRKIEEATPERPGKKDFPARQNGKEAGGQDGKWKKTTKLASLGSDSPPPIEPTGDEPRSAFAGRRFSPIATKDFYGGKTSKAARREERKEENRSKKLKGLSASAKRSNASPYKLPAVQRGKKDMIRRMKPRA